MKLSGELQRLVFVDENEMKERISRYTEGLQDHMNEINKLRDKCFTKKEVYF